MQQQSSRPGSPLSITASATGSSAGERHRAATRLTSVATVLTPAERARVDAAGTGLYRTVHRDSVDECIRDVREHRVDAVVLSAGRCAGPNVPRVAAMVREFPRIPALALVSEQESHVLSAAFTLGQCGVRALVDVRHPAGWSTLRELLADRANGGIGREALASLADDLAEVPGDCWRFFETLFRVPARVTTVRQLTRGLGVRPSTLMSRFFRASLPAPKRYLASARLVRAADLFENPGHSVASVANGLEYSSPQSFGRHVRTVLGITAVEFRLRFDGRTMLQRFREELVLPHLDALRRFTPLDPSPGWLPGR